MSKLLDAAWISFAQAKVAGKGPPQSLKARYFDALQEVHELPADFPPIADKFLSSIARCRRRSLKISDDPLYGFDVRYHSDMRLPLISRPSGESEPRDAPLQ